MKKGNYFRLSSGHILSVTCLTLTLLLSGFFSIKTLHAQTANNNKPYWQYVRTESGMLPYSADGCYQPTVHKDDEGLVDISVSKCFVPEEKTRVRTRLRFEWTKPPRIVYPGEPFDYKISTTLIENSDPNWVISGSIWMRPEMVSDDGPFPGWAGGVLAEYSKGSPSVVAVDNLRLPSAQQAIGPPSRWATNSKPPKMMRITFVVSHSNKYWWAYIYRYVDPAGNSNNKNDNVGQSTGNPGKNNIAKQWQVVETDQNSGQYWKATWKLKEDGFSFDGHWKLFPGGREGDLPGFARIKSISGNQIIIERPGLGTYKGTISANRLSIKGTQTWCSTCIWETSFAVPLPLKFP